MQLIFLFILILLLGIQITIAIKLKATWYERLSLSFLLGIGISTFVLYLLARFVNLNFSLTNTFCVIGVLDLVLFWIKHHEIVDFFRNVKARNTKRKIKPRQILFWGFIMLIFIYTLINNVMWPITDWDALALYDFRAKVLLVNTNFLDAAVKNHFYFAQYPLLTSLTHLFIYQAGANNPKFIYSMFYLSFVLIFYSLLKRNITQKKAMLFTLILALTPEIFNHAIIAYTNLPYLTLLCSGVLYLLSWMKTRDRSEIVLSALLVGLSIWTRIAEPFWIVPLIFVFIEMFKSKNWKVFALYLAVILLFYYSWKPFQVYLDSMNIPLTSKGQLGYWGIIKGITYDKVLASVEYLYKYVFSSWGLVFLIFVVIALNKLLYFKRSSNLVFYIILFFVVLIFAGTVAFSVYYPWWQDIGGSAQRMSLFIIPLMIYYISLLI